MKPRTAPRVTTADLGAWLIKGNADQADLAGRFAADPRVSQWCVQPSYRTRLMRAGQPVVFWASGSRRRDLAYGIWGCGHLAGPARQDPRDGRWKASLALIIAPPTGWVSRATIRADAALADLEVLRQPQAANPSFVTVEQFTVIRRHLWRKRALHRVAGLHSDRLVNESAKRPNAATGGRPDG